MAEKPKSSLQQELDWYESNKAEWLNAHLGEFALVGRKGAVGFYPTYEAAFEAGLKETYRWYLRNGKKSKIDYTFEDRLIEMATVAPAAD